MPALATASSRPSARFANRSTARCSWLRLATSATSARCGPAGLAGSPSTTSSKRSLLRATSPNRAPRDASATHTAWPIPRDAPVTIALVPGSIRTASSSHVAARSRRQLRGSGDHYYRGVTQEQATVAEEEYLQIMFWLEEAGLPI